MQKIPKVSFHDLVAADKAVIDYLTSSLNNVGFFVINEHPINKALIKDTFALTEELFNYPLMLKINTMCQVLTEHEVIRHMA